MARLGCLCGNTVSNVCCPNKTEGEIKGLYEYEYRNVWQCFECGNLAVDIKDNDGLTRVKWYVPDDGKSGDLFDIGSAEQFIDYLKKQWSQYKDSFKQLEADECGGSLEYWRDRAARFEIELNRR